MTKEDSNFYASMKNELSGVIPEDIKGIIADLRTYPRAALWIEVGKALNSFPITEKVDKFRLMGVKELRDFRHAHGISDLSLDDELKSLKKRGYITVGKPPNYFLTPYFAETIEIIKILERNFVTPAVEKLAESGYKEYETLRQKLLSSVLSAID